MVDPHYATWARNLSLRITSMATHLQNDSLQIKIFFQLLSWKPKDKYPPDPFTNLSC